MALALTALVGASSASANTFNTSVETTKWSGGLIGKNHQLKFLDEVGFLNTFTCTGASFSGETTAKTNGEILVTPTLSGCSYLGNPVIWHMNGCKYRLLPGGPVGLQLIGKVDIVGCETAMDGEVPGSCMITVGNQKGIGTVQYVNGEEAGKKVVTAIFNLTGIQFTTHWCAQGQVGTFYGGTYNPGEWKIKGTTSGGTATDVWVESSPLPPPSVFSAEEAPLTVTGTDTGMKLRIGNGFAGHNLSCGSYTLKGTSVTGLNESLAMTPIWKECTVGGFKVPDEFINAFGCHFVLYPSGKFEVAGKECAEYPMFINRPGCIATIGPQVIPAEFTYTNQGSGKLRTISMAGTTVKGQLTATFMGPWCYVQGTHKGAEVKLYSPSKLVATNSLGKQQGISIE